MNVRQSERTSATSSLLKLVVSIEQVQTIGVGRWTSRLRKSKAGGRSVAGSYAEVHAERGASDRSCGYSEQERDQARHFLGVDEPCFLALWVA